MANKYPSLLPTQGDKHQALYQGLLNLGANMGGYSDRPVSFLQQFSKGGQAFGKGYKGALEQTKQGKLKDMQAQAQHAQLEAQKMKIDEANRAQAQAAARNAAMIKRFPSLAPFLGGGIPQPAAAAVVPEAPATDVIPPIPPGTPAPITPVETQPLGVPEEGIIGGAGEDVPGGHPFDDMPIEAVQYLMGSEDKGLASMAAGYLKSKQEQIARGQERGKQAFDVSKEKTKTAMAQQARFTKGAKTFVDVRDAYGRVRSSAKNPSPAGDLSMIFNYMKILDPGSVVRESEFATAAATGSYGERIKAAVSRVLEGKRLSPEMRKDFEDRAGKLYYEQRRTHTKLRNEYKRLSKEYGVRPEKVITNYYGDYITRSDFDTTARENNMPLEAVFSAMAQKFDVDPSYMKAIYEGTD